MPKPPRKTTYKTTEKRLVFSFLNQSLFLILFCVFFQPKAFGLFGKKYIQQPDGAAAPCAFLPVFRYCYHSAGVIGDQTAGGIRQ